MKKFSRRYQKAAKFSRHITISTRIRVTMIDLYIWGLFGYRRLYTWVDIKISLIVEDRYGLDWKHV
jgi:hypothetical protein